jgi:hypothetical protein
MLLEVYYNGPLGKVTETVDLPYQAADRVRELINRLGRSRESDWPISYNVVQRQINLDDVPEQQRPVVYAMIDEELAQLEEQKHELRSVDD